MTEHRFDSRQEASFAAADRIAGLIGKRLEHHPLASLVVSGGTTPLTCFRALADTTFDWGRVQISLSDERWVPPDHEDSNERLVRDTLLVDKAAPATLLPVYAADTTPEERCEALQDPLPELPFSCSLVGMGVENETIVIDVGSEPPRPPGRFTARSPARPPRAACPSRHP